MVRILHDDSSIRLGENRSDQTLKHLAAKLSMSNIAYFSRHKITYHIRCTLDLMLGV